MPVRVRPGAPASVKSARLQGFRAPAGRLAATLGIRAPPRRLASLAPPGSRYGLPADRLQADGTVIAVQSVRPKVIVEAVNRAAAPEGAAIRAKPRGRRAACRQPGSSRRGFGRRRTFEAVGEHRVRGIDDVDAPVGDGVDAEQSCAPHDMPLQAIGPHLELSSGVNRRPAGRGSLDTPIRRGRRGIRQVDPLRHRTGAPQTLPAEVLPPGGHRGGGPANRVARGPKRAAKHLDRRR